MENQEQQAPIVESQVESTEPSEAIEEVTAPEAVIEEKKEEIKKLNRLKLKVHGQEIDEELPFSFDENPAAVEYLTKQLQLAKASQKAMQENSTYKSQVQQFFNSLKTNTKEILSEMGIDPKEFAAQVIEDEIRKQQMSPEQIELEQLRAEKKRLEETSKKEKEEFDKRELERLESMEYERLEGQMTKALETSHLPKSPKTVQRIAQYMLMGVQNGVELTPADVLPLVEQDYQEELKEILSAMGEDNVENFIGKDVINKIRKKNIAKSKVTPGTLKSQIKDVANQKQPEVKEVKKQSLKSFFDI